MNESIPLVRGIIIKWDARSLHSSSLLRKISFGSQILQGLTPGAGTTQQTISPMPVGNPYLQAAGAITGLGTGLGALIGN